MLVSGNNMLNQDCENGKFYTAKDQHVVIVNMLPFRSKLTCPLVQD